MVSTDRSCLRLQFSRFVKNFLGPRFFKFKKKLLCPVQLFRGRSELLGTSAVKQNSGALHLRVF
jgi:hypothetical protein